MNMRKSIIILLIFLLLFSFGFAREKIINRYGLELILQGNRYKLKEEMKIRQLHVFDPDSAPADMYVPYKKSQVFIKDADYKQCITRTFVFKTYPGREMKLEVDLPTDASKKHPYIIWIHGGGWHSGNYNGHKPFSRYLASHGVAGVRISYSLLTDGAEFKDTWQDIRDAVAYIREHAAEWGLEVDRFGFAGHSAGGHLSAYAAMRVPGTKLLVSMNGVYDLEHIVPGFVPTARHDKYFGTSAEERKNASPLFFVHPGAPYCVLTYSTGDLLIDNQQIIRFEAALKKNNVPYEILSKAYYSHLAFAGTDLYEPMLMKILILAQKYL